MNSKINLKYIEIYLKTPTDCDLPHLLHISEDVDLNNFVEHEM